MSYTYTWADTEQTTLKREDDQGNVAWVPADPANRDYAEFCNCGATAAAYVAPPQSTEVKVTLTSEQKFERLLKDYNLTKDELVGVLNAKGNKPAQAQPAQQSPKLDTTGVDQLLPLSTQQLMDVAKTNNIMVEQHLLDPANHQALAEFIAAAMNLQNP